VLYEVLMELYNSISDRVAVTCESCDQRSPCGGSF